MKSIYSILNVCLVTVLLSACGSSATTSSGGGGGSGTVNKDASNCVSRSLRTVYVNECNYAVNAILFKAGANAFHINPNNAATRSSSGNSFGACRAPSMPVLNASNSGISCS